MAYITCGIFNIEEVLPFVTERKSRKIFTVGDTSYEVNMDSPRYHCFKKSLACAKCGIIGTKFLLQKHEIGTQRYHFNLYAEKDNELILMTKDHIHPKSKGGSDKIANFQTMCYDCNQEKGNTTE